MNGPKPDTSNWFLVSGFGDGRGNVQMTAPPGGGGACIISRAQAVNLAAWLVAIADPAGREFEAVLRAIQT